jgi:thiol-disulfide isomerase/thioredoxin
MARLRAAKPLVWVAAFVVVAGLVLIAPSTQAQSGARPWLGVAMDAGAQGAGVRVAHVVRGSPADRAGVREGDRIVRIGGAQVANGSDVIRAVAARAVGEVLEVALVRAGSAQTARVLLGPFPSQDEMARMDLVGAAAPTWRGLEAVSGAFPSSVEATRGRVILIDFWATWCAPCRMFTSKLGALQTRYAPQGFTVLGVSTEDAQDVVAFARSAAIKYPIAVDPSGETTRSYGVTSLPTVVLVDKRGNVRDVAIGYDGDEDARLDAAIRALLAEQPNPGADRPVDPPR